MLFKGIMERFFGWKILLEIPESKITVAKRRSDRVLLYTNVIYSKLDDRSIYTHSYWDYLSVLATLYRKPGVLVLGLAGGAVPYQISKLLGGKASIDAVEIDRNMVRAMRVFLPERIKAKIVLADGYEYAKRARKRYDLIILDIFKGLDIPKRFMRQDFIDRLHGMLTKDGILAINYTFRHAGMRRPGFTRRLRKRFTMYTLSEPRLFGNCIFVCSKGMSKAQITGRMARNLKRDGENSFIFDAYGKMA